MTTSKLQKTSISTNDTDGRIGQQKSCIIENATILNKETKIAILSIVMMEIGPSVIMEAGGSKEVDIDLDAVAASNEEVLAHIYNIVQTRRAALNRPAGITRTLPVGTR